MAVHFAKVITLFVVALMLTKSCISIRDNEYPAISLCQNYDTYNSNKEEFHARVDAVCPEGLKGTCQRKYCKFDNNDGVVQDIGICKGTGTKDVYDYEILHRVVTRETITIKCVTIGGVIWDYNFKLDRCILTGTGTPPVSKKRETASGSNTKPAMKPGTQIGSSNSPESGTSLSHTSLSDSETEYYDVPTRITCKAKLSFDAGYYRSLNTDENYLFMKVGEEFEVIEPHYGNGWTRVRRTTGKKEEGLVPSTHIDCHEHK